MFSKVLGLTLFCALMAFGVAYQCDLFGLQVLVSQHLPHIATGGVMVASVALFPVDQELTSVSVAYRNRRFIADEVLPRVPVGNQEFKYRKYNLADSFTIPNTRVGRTSKPNEMGFGFTETAGLTFDYGLDDPIPQADIMNAPAGYDPKAHASQQLTDLILLDREKRVADMVFDTNNYGAANKVTLAGNDQLSDFTNSDPIGVIQTALDSVIMRANILVFGRAVWAKVSMHPKILKAVHGNSGDTGIARRQQVADLFEVDEVLVGEGIYSSAHKGQTPVLVNLWGKCIAALYRDKLADARSGVTYGFTAQWGSRVSGSIPDPNIGARGGERVRVAESVKEVVTANDLGYLVLAAVA